MARSPICWAAEIAVGAFEGGALGSPHRNSEPERGSGPFDRSPFFWSRDVVALLVVMDSVDLRHTIRALLEPTVQRAGFDLVAVEWLSSRSGATLRLSIDKADGVTAGDCGRVTDKVSPLLDEADPISGRYVLEVSSPGIERPVQRLEDFQRFIGFRVKVKLVEGPPRRRYTGSITRVEARDVILTVDDAEHRISFDTIERANLDLTLEEYQSLSGAAGSIDDDVSVDEDPGDEIDEPGAEELD
jgi:ribosome maturation factor RimP